MIDSEIGPRDVVVDGRIMRVFYDAYWLAHIQQADGYKLVRGGHLTLHAIPKHRGCFVALDEVKELARQLREGELQLPKDDDYKADSQLRAAVLARNQEHCRYCGADLTIHYRTACIDHILPYMQGGPTTIDNLVTACRSCNQKKGNRTPEQARMKLLPIPFVTH